VAEGAAGWAVDGDMVAVEEDGDLAAGVGSADGDEGPAGEVDVAVAEDGEDFDLGVLLNRELAGTAAGWGVVPGLLRGFVPYAVAAAGVVPVLVAVAGCLQLGDGGWRWLVGEPGFEGVMVPLDLAAGLWMVGAGVDQPGAGGGDDPGEPGDAGAAGSAGER